MTPMVNGRTGGRDLSFFLAGFLVLWTIRGTLFYPIDESITSPVWRGAYSNLLKFVLWVLPAVAFACRVRRMPPARYLGVSVVPNLRNWILCLAVTVAFLVLVALFELTIGGKSFSGAGLASLPVVLALLQLVLSPWFEEVLFRGLVLKELLTLLPAYPANALTSALFVGVHLPYWLSHEGANRAVLAAAFGVFVFSVVAGWLFAKSASIWPPTLAHIANNVLASSLVVSRG